MNDGLTQIFTEVTEACAEVFARMDIAEEEIAAAQKRHPDAADKVWHAFKLLNPGNLRHERLNYELVYRAHVRELLDRVATSADLRPGTAAEALCVLTEASQVAPMNTVGSGLYMRMWVAAGIADVPEITEASESYEALYASRIDDEEAEVRRRLTARNRIFDEDIDCHGYHHGEPVTCRYATETDSENASDSASGNDSDNPPQITD